MLCVLIVVGMLIFVNVTSSLMRGMSPHLVCIPCMCIWWCNAVFWCLDVCVSFVSCILMMAGCMLCAMYFNSSIMFLLIVVC